MLDLIIHDCLFSVMSADSRFDNNQATGSYSGGGALYFGCTSGCKAAYNSSSRFSLPLLLHVLILIQRVSNHQFLFVTQLTHKLIMN
jgi:predicted outer membrane repeat protein